MMRPELHLRTIATRHHHLNGHEKGAIIALSAVAGVFAIVIAALAYIWRTERARSKAMEEDLEGKGSPDQTLES
jgi:hypothetical protein